MKLITTADGSKSIFLTDIEESYHSSFGAKSESEHIYIQHGLLYKSENLDTLTVLEIGLGTGLNAFLSFIHGANKNIHYIALEPFPLPFSIIEQLNYSDCYNLDNNQFLQFHDNNWDVNTLITNNFSFLKSKAMVQDFTSELLFDVVYFDAFSPAKQPELWDKEIFEKLYKLMNNEAALVTYCAKGSFKRMLKEIGFKVEILPGPNGKREIVRAIKI
jgi:tRNA U34 5-methylaminomethyl-2-thiouridine-forming methyltransferase MnmC